MYKNWMKIRKAIAESNQNKEGKLNSYIMMFAKSIDEKGKETCRGWIASNISNDYKLLFDEETLREILQDEKPIRMINAFLYGLMLSWAMANDDRSLVSMAEDASSLIIKLISE